MIIEQKTTAEAVKDEPLISKEGKILRKEIEGLIVKLTPTIEDERGELVEVYRPSWGISAPSDLVHAYYTTLRPGVIKGWVVHKFQDDRIFVFQGTQNWAFFDSRPESLTYKNVVKFTFSERNRALIIIPKGVFHAVKNVGAQDTMFINLPTKAYDRESPDKFRLPVKNDLIPYDFSDTN